MKGFNEITARCLAVAPLGLGADDRRIDILQDVSRVVLPSCVGVCLWERAPGITTFFYSLASPPFPPSSSLLQSECISSVPPILQTRAFGYISKHFQTTLLKKINNFLLFH